MTKFRFVNKPLRFHYVMYRSNNRWLLNHCLNLDVQAKMAGTGKEPNLSYVKNEVSCENGGGSINLRFPSNEMYCRDCL